LIFLDFLQIKLLQSLDKLLAAVFLSVKEFGFLLEKLEKACQNFTKELGEMSSSCECQDLWVSKHFGALTFSEATEWIEDLLSLAQKEFEFKQSLAKDANYDNLEKMSELWNSQPFLGMHRIHHRVEQMKVISMMEVKSDYSTGS
jgi:hypothetical protein